jgi:peptide/nickel transport system substrate-binding protein
MLRIFSFRSVAMLALFCSLLALASTQPAIGRDEEEDPKAKAPKKVSTEEEEPAAGVKPKKKIEVEDPENEPAEPLIPKLPTTKPMVPTAPLAPSAGGETEAPQEAPTGVYVAKLDDLTRAATTARHPDLRDFFLKHTYAFDKLFYNNGRSIRITPVPLLWGTDRFPASFGIAPLTDDNVSGEVLTLSPRQVSRIDPFEKIMIEETQKLLTPTTVKKDGPKRTDSLIAAERALMALLFFHDAARDAGKRRGKSWEPMKAIIYDKLTESRVLRMTQAAQDADWQTLRDLGQRYSELYKNNAKALEQIFAAKLLEAVVLVKSDKVADLERGRELLNQYESRFPGTNNESAKKVRQTLADRAKNFLANAQRTMPSNASEARNILKTVEAFDPDNSDLRQLQNQLKTGYPVLIVGTKRLPLNMSPALARFDSELWATELLFEGLFEAIPDEQDGVRYRLGLAADRPTVGAGMRDVSLIRSADFGTGRGFFDATDIAGTIRLLRQRSETQIASILPWMNDPGFDPADPGRVRLRFKLGHPDPRSLLTFKIHPAQWLLQQNKLITDPDFAKQPFGTGPYRLDPKYKPPGPDAQPKDIVFLSNPAYGRRNDKLGMPYIKEIRFTDVNQMPEPANEFRGDRLHLLVDVPSTELSRYTANNNLNGRVRVVTPNINRRIMMLAINHRRAALQDIDLRRGLLHAIDRERVLSEVYRGTVPNVHKSLNGPFPVASWATPKSASASLYNRDLAASRFRAFYQKPLNVAQLNLLYCNDDPQAKTACERMKAMIESCTATEERKLVIALEPLTPREFLRRVEVEQSYDLAYMPYDYRDDWYPLNLGMLLDPAASIPGGRNFLGFPAKGGITSPEEDRLMRVVDEARQHRDPAKLEQLAQGMHRAFNEAVPFVPLWQLDRHIVISTAVKLYFDGRADEMNPQWIDATTLFHSVAKWKLE